MMNEYAFEMATPPFRRFGVNANWALNCCLRANVVAADQPDRERRFF